MNDGIGRELLSRLTDTRHDPVDIVRDESQLEATHNHGGEPRPGGLEGGFESTLSRANVVVFTAGPGGSTGTDKTLMVNPWGTRRVVDVCVEAGTDRLMMISSTGAGDPLSGPEALRPYLAAKRCVDDYLEQSPLDATVPRPTRLTDTEGIGPISLTAGSPDGDTPEIPRADIAQMVVTSLDIDRTIGETLTLTGSDTTIERMLRGDD